MATTNQSSAQQNKPTESGYAPVNGIEMYYEIYGEGMPIVLLHGAYYTIEMNWSSLIAELSKTRKVIALEMQGHGHTPYSDRQLTRATLARDVESLMDYLKIDSADVVGYSFGGSVAYQFAIQSPKRLRKLVIISAVHKSSSWLPEVNEAFKGMKPEFFDNSPLHTAYDAVAPDKTKWTKFLEQMIASAITPYDLGDANIAKISAPVLMIAGDNDGIDKVELVKTYQLLKGNKTVDLGAIPESQLAIIPGQGHVSLMMQTQTLFGFINGFLQ
ncbi:alpha/beta fold hydrolase [Flavilitoribacter nigricans]|uniref:Alpha/beta hydrolase n=1 Tax=Flavilitoribacter nigricans (strain ATCC 23147 / DSM 23189 / NBRC 102662 / NCIMB 1420 / SS-2) TaxID=1122177 RepID=A0A2D0NEU8_FLAN2|nr:alpha/beta hydrolase [Flavilitoribacter nigricans]PHN07044.1 alpha/beta hydrolase [Flavilitoribacter nigricans DSM 23189 = NBRC 102662]